eukprot:CAMPEP_0113484530 /NCGR_PEP_ID=MMETSP0014_2-20120614/24007_1 /TAXON_ID=2857 /ORGANISM="Nitzschia sp." /LENGTH=226 /DNA_ID=CAMNT_0000378131 /DNA_START=122 /DNA_END=802 /DNA_ORIENTATION=+ /assembly_acc=CAM_ASM_000159
MMMVLISFFLVCRGGGGVSAFSPHNSVPVVIGSQQQQQQQSRSPSSSRSSTTNLIVNMAKARNGLEWDDVEIGTGRKIKPGDAILCYYEGSFQQAGRKFVFDATEDGEPFEVVVGKGEVIDGWDLGVLGSQGLEIEPMRIGGDRKLKIPAGLAYGPVGAGGGIIPPDQDLEFQIEIVNAQKTGGVSGDVMTKGLVGFAGFLGFLAIVGIVIVDNIDNLREALSHRV